MSDNPYLDTYWVQYVLNNEEILAAWQVRATDFEHAKSIVVREEGLEGPNNLRVTRYRAPTLIKSPSDKLRDRRRSQHNRRRTPQFHAGKKTA